MSKASDKITLQNIADRLNISKNAVSLALNGKPGVSKETRKMVQSLAKKLNYPAAVREEKGKNALIVVPDYIQNDRYFYNDIFWAIDSNLKNYGCNSTMVMISEDLQKQQRLPPICSEISFPYCVTIGILGATYIQNLLESGTRLISVDQDYYKPNIHCVLTANLAGSYYISQKVIEFDHKEIGFIGCINETSSIYERFCGFQKAMLEAGLEVHREYCILEDSPLSVLLSNPTELLSKFKNFDRMPTAFVCGGDRIAIAAIEALNRIGYRVPEDISVVGFDDIELSSFISPKLTTMRVNRAEMSRIAVEQLLKSDENHEEPSCVSLYPKYVKRDSLDWAKQHVDLAVKLPNFPETGR